MEIDKIYNEDCLKTMERLDGVNMVMTSPPYNTSRKGSSLDAADTNIRYDEFDDCRSDEEYIGWTVDIFNSFDKILAKNGVVLYNISYSAENTALMWLTIAAIISRTGLTVADNIVWKKKSAVPNNESPNKLTRIVEYVLVCCRKTELATFQCFKEESSRRPTGQVLYKNYFNFVEAPNNDENCPIHKATYSTQLCRKLMQLYSKEGDVIYDPFMGTGTTAIAAIREKRHYVGSELSPRYCDWANNRIRVETSQLSLF